jgi:hypothetical protein
MSQKVRWKRTIGGAIIIFLVIWFGTMISIGSIMELSTGKLATVLAFTAIITYIVFIVVKPLESKKS